MRRDKRPVLPFDLQLGGFSEDGQGALGLHANFFKEPPDDVPSHRRAVKGRLDSMSLQEPIYGLTRSQISLLDCSRLKLRPGKQHDLRIFW